VADPHSQAKILFESLFHANGHPVALLGFVPNAPLKKERQAIQHIDKRICHPGWSASKIYRNQVLPARLSEPI
jgi:hypothetical protein